ncbi:hypothetical protein SUGI_1281330 [Cryptomeria japonica]|uniref:Uncharacterized protein n=1 Tax=Cryptomeria japonica TaxID=3369 RepID=A0AAD3RQ71_CRYJA|nr:hypothetical protein SUGI_1281330 [Cryptomeria japonica]
MRNPSSEPRPALGRKKFGPRVAPSWHPDEKPLFRAWKTPLSPLTGRRTQGRIIFSSTLGIRGRKECATNRAQPLGKGKGRTVGNPASRDFGDRDAGQRATKKVRTVNPTYDRAKKKEVARIEATEG